ATACPCEGRGYYLIDASSYVPCECEHTIRQHGPRWEASTVKHSESAQRLTPDDAMVVIAYLRSKGYPVHIDLADKIQHQVFGSNTRPFIMTKLNSLERYLI